MASVIDLIPHRPPWLVVDRLVASDGESASVEKQLGRGEPWLDDQGGLAEPLLVDLLAQTAACWLGSRGTGEAGAIGYLVAVRGFEFHRRAQAGETLTLTVHRLSSLGSLVAFRAAAAVEAEEIAHGELTCALPNRRD